MDTTVLVGLVDAQSVYHSACVAFFQRAVDPAQAIQLVTATLTLDEVVFVLLQEMVALPPYSIVRSRSQYLHDHPEVVRALMIQLDPLVEALFDLVALEPVTAADMARLTPGTTPLKAIAKLPGVNFQSADAFGAWPTTSSVAGLTIG